MTHIKNINLTVLPEMSKRHSALLKAYSNKMAYAYEIWQSCESVWRELDSVSIDGGFILMHHISKKVIIHKGTNTFLKKIDFHSGVRNSFANTPDGVKPKVNVLD